MDTEEDLEMNSMLHSRKQTYENLINIMKDLISASQLLNRENKKKASTEKLEFFALLLSQHEIAVRKDFDILHLN